MSLILLFLVLITPFAYVLSPYLFVLVFIAEAFLFIRDVEGEGNRFLLLMLLTVMCSCIAVAGIRLYDVIIVVGFIVSWIKKRGHLFVSYNIFPFLFLIVIVGVFHSGTANLIEMARYIVCILLFIATYNKNYSFDEINGKLVGIAMSNLYFAVMVFLLNEVGRIKEYSGVIASNIYVFSSTSELRLNGFFSDPNKYMAFCFAMLFIVEVWMQKGKLKNFVLLILCVSSLISMSRTAILSLLAYLFLKVLKSTFRKSKVLAVVLEGIIISIILLLVFIPGIFNNFVNYLFVTSARLMGREHTLLINTSFQSDNRVIIWRQAFRLIKIHPFLGHGWNSIRALLPYPTHNTLLELLMDSGIIGLICYLIFMSKLFFNKYYEYTIPFVLIPALFLDMGGYRVLFLLLGLVYWAHINNMLEERNEKKL